MRTVNKKKNKLFIYVIAIFFVVFYLSSGYSAFGDTLGITSIVTHIRAHKEVRINGVSTGSGYVTDLDYDFDRIVNNVQIPAHGSITYTTTVTNLLVPVAVSGVRFVDGNGNTVNGLTSNFTNGYYEKICEGNNCNGPVSKDIDIIITNNTDEVINSRLYVILTFSEVYTVTFEGNYLGEAIKGSTFTHDFTSGSAPTKLAVATGSCDSIDYTNNTVTLTNVQSNIDLIEAHTVMYNGSLIGNPVVDGDTFTYHFDSKWPATVTKDSGTGNFSYQNHTISITDVRSNIVLSGTIGNVSITRISYVSSKNVVDPTADENMPTFEGMNANFNVTFRKEEGSTDEGFEIIYEVDLTNTHYDDYIFRGFDFHPDVNASAESDTATLTLTPIGVDNGDVVKSDTVKTFRIVLTLTASNPDGSYETGSTTQVDTTPDTEEETGEITATISPDHGNLRSPNTSASFTLSVTSTYPSDRTFSLISSNSNLEIVGGNNLTIHGESTEPYNITIKPVAGAQFVSDTDSMTVYLSSDGMKNINVGTLTFDVNKHSVPDTTKVTVGNADLTYYYDTSDNKPKIKATWDRKDYGGTPVTNYVVLVYQSDDTYVTKGETNSAIREYAFDNLSENTSYYVIVYGIDQATNSGENDVSNATTSDGFATKSSSKSFKWTYSVNTSGLSDLDSSNKTAILGSTFSTTITATGGTFANQVPDSLTVSMDGTSNLSNGNGFDYTKDSNSKATLKVYNVTGNISLSGSATCLVEGTKILLANGEYKNIEKIGYDDLLMVHNYETGELTYEYPIWIEKAKSNYSYQENTFSDGTILKTVGWHGLFETELNRFVSVDNPEEFHIGSKIAKYNNDKKQYETVTVTNIETKYETVNYYHVVSTRYYNIIANDFLTTDGTVILSNLYGFDKNITWPSEIRNYAMNDVYSYDELSDAIPYYMFKGLRAEEGKILSNYGLDLDTFKGYLLNNQNNPDMVKQPIQKLGRNMWMVTTSLDNINVLNRHNYLREEGSIYTLPVVNDKKFAYWLNTSDNKKYYSGDELKVYHGMHFVAVYK